MTDCSKIRTRWKIVIIFDHPRRTLVLDRRPGNRAAILRSEIHRHRSHGCSDRRCSVRAFDDSTGEAVGGRRLARTPPRRVTRWLATSIIAPPALALSSAGDELPPPSRYFRLQKSRRGYSRRCLQRVKSRITTTRDRALMVARWRPSTWRRVGQFLRTSLDNGSLRSRSNAVSGWKPDRLAPRPRR